MRLTHFAAMLGVLTVIHAGTACASLTLADQLLFGPAAVVDETSGNSINFAYTHTFPDLAGTSFQLLGATLTLEHEGNAAEGPTREIWDIASGGSILGRLSNSESGPAADQWIFSGEALDLLFTPEPGLFYFGLIEQTSFNRESMSLIRSELTIQYKPESASVPQAPEPLSALMVGSGILGAAWRKKSRQF